MVVDNSHFGRVLNIDIDIQGNVIEHSEDIHLMRENVTVGMVREVVSLERMGSSSGIGHPDEIAFPLSTNPILCIGLSR